MATLREKRQLEERVMRQRQKVVKLQNRVDADRQRLAKSERVLREAQAKERELIAQSNKAH